MSARGETISRNFAVLSAGQLAAKMLAFIVTIRLTRVLETDAFGMIAFGTSVLAYAAMVIDFGLDTLGAIEAARNRIPLRDLVRCIVSIRIGLMAVAFALLLGFVWIAPITQTTRVVLILYGLSLFAEVFHLDWAFLGIAEMKPVAAAEIIWQVVLAIGVLLFVHSPADVYRVPLFYVAGRTLAIAAIAWQFVRNFGPLSLRLDPLLAKRLLRDALPLTGSAVLAMLLNNFDLVLIGLTVGAAATGLYGAAYRIVWLPTMVATAYYTALRPALAKASVEGLQTIEALLARSVRLTSILAVASVAAAAFLSGHVLKFLYGNSYNDAQESLSILLGAFALLVVSRNFRSLLVCFGKQRIEFVMLAVAATVNVALNIVLIPRRGISGAALASLASEACILVFGYVATRIYVGHISLGRALIRPLLAGVPLTAIFYATPSLNIVLRVLSGFGVYALALFALGAVSVEDLRILFRGAMPLRLAAARDGSPIATDATRLAVRAAASVLEASAPADDPALRIPLTADAREKLLRS